MKNHQRKNKKVPGSVRKPTCETVVMVKSPIKNRPDVVFFSYPHYVGKEKESYQKLKEYDQASLSN